MSDFNQWLWSSATPIEPMNKNEPEPFWFIVGGIVMVVYLAWRIRG